MSGGYFSYKQHNFLDVLEEISELIAKNNSNLVDEDGYVEGNHYPKEIIECFENAVRVIGKAYKMADEIDRLLSCDSSEETFLQYWNEEIATGGKFKVN